MTAGMNCDIYKSPRKEQMYLYVETGRALADVPETLLESFGEPEFVMRLMLKPGTKLARVERDEVERLILEQGYFLQMPPASNAFVARHGQDNNNQIYSDRVNKD